MTYDEQRAAERERLEAFRLPPGPVAPAPVDLGPGTLGAALEAEAAGLGAVRFHEGVPYWEAGGFPSWVGGVPEGRPVPR